MRRLIRHNASEAGPQSIFVIDTEGTPVESSAAKGKSVHYLRCWSLGHWRWEKGQWTREDTMSGPEHVSFWSYFAQRLQRHRTNWVFGFGMGYHLQILRIWEMIEQGYLVFSGKAKSPSGDASQGKPPELWQGVLCLQDPPIYVSCRWKDGSPIKFVDFGNWVQSPIGEIADLVGSEKPIDVSETSSDDDAFWVVEQRVRVGKALAQRLCGMVKDQALGQFRPTLAGQAYHAWRHPHVPCEVVSDSDPAIRQLERQAYYGGRCHVYFCGTCYTANLRGVEQLAGINPMWPSAPLAPIYHLDVVGCYGSVMQDNKYPVKLYRVLNGITPEELHRLSSAYCVIAEVTIRSQDVPYPQRDKQEVWWKVGTLRTVLCGPELRPAMIAGRVKSVGRVQVYIADRPFGPFVDRLWRMRQMYTLSGKQLEAKLAKNLMAMLHGKLAQRAPRWTLLPGVLPLQPWGIYTDWSAERQRYVQRRAIGSIVQEETPPGEPQESMPALSAYVTSYARQLMSLIRDEAMRHCVVYEDADSLHVTQEGLDRLGRLGWLDEHSLGKLRVVGSTDRAVYYGRKDYQFGTKIVRAGLQRDAVQLPHGDWHQAQYASMDSVLIGVPPAGPVAIDQPTTYSHDLLGSASTPSGWTAYLIAE